MAAAQKILILRAIEASGHSVTRRFSVDSDKASVAAEKIPVEIPAELMGI